MIKISKFKIKAFVSILLGFSIHSVFAETSVQSHNTSGVSSVSYQNVAKTYTVEAVVEATKQSTISAQTAGRITQIMVDAGDIVKKGQVLAKIDPTEINQSLNINSGQIAQAQAQVDNAKAYYNRVQQLVSQKFMSQANLDKAEADYKLALAQLKTAQASQGHTSVNRNYTTITAPYTGVVSARMIQVGELAMPSRPILTYFDPQGLRVIVNIPQASMNKIQMQYPATVEFMTLNQTIKSSQITVVPSADKNTHVTTVRIDLPSDQLIKGIYPGMFAKAHFTTAYERKLVVPTQAILKRSELTAVYVMNDQKLPQLRQVRIGDTFSNGQFTEILAGLNPNEKVANNPIQVGINLSKK